MKAMTSTRCAQNDDKAVAFSTAEDVWFWFIGAQEAKVAGARVASGLSSVPRPCEPVDILLILDRLYRNRRLQRDHVLVLRHYGRRRMAPDSDRPKEKRAAFLWNQALEILSEPLIKKGIIDTPETHSGGGNSMRSMHVSRGGAMGSLGMMPAMKQGEFFTAGGQI